MHLMAAQQLLPNAVIVHGTLTFSREFPRADIYDVKCDLRLFFVYISLSLSSSLL